MAPRDEQQPASPVVPEAEVAPEVVRPLDPPLQGYLVHEGDIIWEFRGHDMRPFGEPRGTIDDPVVLD